MDQHQARLFPSTRAEGADASEVCVGGRAQPRHSHLRWVLRQPNGTGVIRLFGYVVAKVLRRTADDVTFDQASFQSALDHIPDGTLVIVAPSHRSYIDFLLCSFLFFARPDLGIAMPHIAAAEEFSKIPVLGWLFEKANAFFVKRGMRKKDYVELTTRVTELVRHKQTLQIFLEGTRSRARQFLAPRHGLLKCIQETGQPATILPIAISYDRVTEEASFLDELQGSPKPEMMLRALTAWTTRMLRGQIKIGRVHIACGTPIKLDKFDHLRSVTGAVMGQLQQKTVATTFHLQSFLEHNPIEGADLDWLRAAIVERGGRVLDSECGSRGKPGGLLERCMRYQWMHVFYTEARTAFLENPAVQHHIARNGFLQTPAMSDEHFRSDPRIDELLVRIFAPICRDYALVADALGEPGDSIEGITAVEIVREHPSAFLPDVEAAFEALISQRILGHGEERGTYRWSRRAEDIYAFRRGCELPVDSV
ncbi:MAG: 1-acyl-sn-glycerol-3-phosphate acyltransferase [Candidatus Binataceae bacterium]